MGDKITSMKVSKRNTTRLNKLKYKIGTKNIDETLDKMFILISKFKLDKELGDL